MALREEFENANRLAELRNEPASTVLILPGWNDSGPRHWQTIWEQTGRRWWQRNGASVAGFA